MNPFGKFGTTYETGEEFADRFKNGEEPIPQPTIYYKGKERTLMDACAANPKGKRKSRKR